MIGRTKRMAAANMLMSDLPSAAAERNSAQRTVPYRANHLHPPADPSWAPAPALHVAGPRAAPNGQVNGSAAPILGSRTYTAPPPPTTQPRMPAYARSIKPKGNTLPLPTLPFSGGTKSRKRHICARCLTQLGRFFNTGSPCPSCGERICSSCRIRVYLPKKTWLCTLCVQERQLRLTTGDWTLKRTEILMRAPMSIAAEAEIRTLPRKGKLGVSQMPLVPLSSSSFSPATLLRPYKTPVTAVVPQIEPQDGEYYTATRGRPVATFTSPITRKKVIKRKDRRNTVQVVTVPISQLDTYLDETPVKNSTLVRKVKAEAKMNAMKSPVIKEKFEHVSVATLAPQRPRPAVSDNPQGGRRTSRDGMDWHPRLMTGFCARPLSILHNQYIKSATIDRAYIRRPPAVADTVPVDFLVAPSPPPPEASADPLAATLPRAHRKVQRDESLLSAYSYMRASEEPGLPTPHSMSLLSLHAKKVTANNRAGIRHPSYAGSIDRTVFNRVDNRRRSFATPRSSLRRSMRDDSDAFDSLSLEEDEPVRREIVNALILDYDYFLSVIKGRLQEVALYWLHLVSCRPDERMHVSIIEIKPAGGGVYRENGSAGSFPPEKSNIFHITEHRHPEPVEVIVQESPVSPPGLSRKNSMRRSSGRKFILPIVPIEPPVHFRDVERSEVVMLDSDNDLLSESSTDISEAMSLEQKTVEYIRTAVPVVSVESEPEPLPVKPARRKSKEKAALMAAVGLATTTVVTSESIARVVEHEVLEPAAPIVTVTREISGEDLTFEPKMEEILVEEHVLPSLAASAEERYTDHLIKPKPRRKSREHVVEIAVEPGLFNGLPKLRETPKTEKITPGDEIPEFQRVRERLRDTKAPEKVTVKVDEDSGEDLDDVRKVSTAIQHFKKINQEVQDLKEFLKLVRTNASSVVKDDVVVEEKAENVKLDENVVENGTYVHERSDEDMAMDDLDTVLETETRRSDKSQVSPVSDVESDKLVDIKLNDSFHDSGRFSEPETPTDEQKPFVHESEEVVVKKCVPAARPVLLSQGSLEMEDELERESNSSVVSDSEVLPVRKARRVEPTGDSDDERELHSPDDVDVWELEAVQQMRDERGDYFGRLQVPLYTIEEESEDDEDRETAFTRLTNHRLRQARMFSVDSASDEAESDAEHEMDMRENGSHLEQYFITGLLQPVGKKQPYFRADMDLDALEEDEMMEKHDVQPSIFKSARLNFASADYRLSSDNDMDDLSEGNSDDESLYY